MRILPVLDLLTGQVVRGVAGRRQEYRPIVSRLTTSCRPLDVARAFREHFGLRELYLADLDAIAGAAPTWPIYTTLRADGFRLWVDTGVRVTARAEELAAAGIEQVVLGLETIAGPTVLAEAVSCLGAERIVFSLDLKGGMPLGNLSAWARPDVESIAAQVVATGVRRLIVLDLAQVGVGSGTGTEDLCSRLVAAYPELEVIAGGGVRNAADLRRLAACGVRAALVASALHDGRLRPEEVERG
jgi:phosphoribosylformimino-5-aminoimidazole carboxamide ribotide isomerase